FKGKLEHKAATPPHSKRPPAIPSSHAQHPPPQAPRTPPQPHPASTTFPVLRRGGVARLPGNALPQRSPSPPQQPAPVNPPPGLASRQTLRLVPPNPEPAGHPMTHHNARMTCHQDTKQAVTKPMNIFNTLGNKLQADTPTTPKP
ncbi:hypothetical protein PTTG_30392, partial [Puccinia triticina 1-1 BBBD Race 1]